MNHLRLYGTIGTLLAAGAFGCSSSSSGSPDAGSYGSEEGGPDGGDDAFVGPVDAASLDDAGATSVCPALKAYAKCNVTDPCAALDLKDCPLFDGLYSTAGRKAFAACYGSSTVCGPDAGDVTDCLSTAAAEATPDTAQKKLATDFCAACPTDGASCAANFYSNVEDDAGNIGLGVTLGLSLMSDETVKMLDSTCVSGLTGGMQDCGFAFAGCVGPIINPPAQSCESQMTGGGDAGNDADPGGA